MKTHANHTSLTGSVFANFIGGNINQIRTTDAEFNEIIDEMMGSLMLEAVNHFTKFTKPSFLADDARYFYTDKEMKTFFKMLIERDMDLSVLRINTVYNEDGETFLCYEVCRSKIFDRISGTPKDVYYGTELVDMSRFLPVV